LCNTSYKIQVITGMQIPSPSPSSPSSQSLSTATAGAMQAGELPDAVKITAPAKRQQLPVAKDLKVSGTSIDNATSTCSVLVNLNGVRPNQNAVAAGPNGSNDYSKWNALLTSKHSSVKEGNNRINARINCSDVKGLAAHFNVRTSVSVVGVP
jgi:phosphatidate phosphatase PAH1